MPNPDAPGWARIPDTDFRPYFTGSSPEWAALLTWFPGRCPAHIKCASTLGTERCSSPHSPGSMRGQRAQLLGSAIPLWHVQGKSPLLAGPLSAWKGSGTWSGCKQACQVPASHRQTCGSHHQETDFGEKQWDVLILSRHGRNEKIFESPFIDGSKADF